MRESTSSTVIAFFCFLASATSVWYQSADPEIMLPRRQQRVEGVYEREMDQLIDKQFEQMMEQITKEVYHEENLFYDTDDGEDVDAIIGDEPIFDEEDQDDVEYIDFIGVDKIFYSCVPLTFILKELQVDQKLVLFYPSNNKFLSQYLGKIRGRIFSTLEEMMRSSKQFAEQANIINFYYLMQFWELQGFFCFEIYRVCYLKSFRNFKGFSVLEFVGFVI